MFYGPLLPLSPDLPLSKLLACARPGIPLGAWIRPGVSQVRVYQFSHYALCPGSVVLASSNLGVLLGHCREVAVREGAQSRVLPAEVVIHWRALQVATATPHLPGIQRLRAQFPDMNASVNGLLIPMWRRSPEEVLAHCVAEGVRVTGSRIVYECARSEAVVRP